MLPVLMASESEYEIAEEVVTLEIVEEVVGVTEEKTGTVVSITRALLAPNEPEAPGVGRVRVASVALLAALIVPEFKVSELVPT
jgi:hypothetical protein